LTVVGFVGLGLIGSRRLEIVRGLGCEIAFAVDPDLTRREAQRATLPSTCAIAPTIYDLDQHRLDRIDAIFVAVPHDQALEVSSWAIDHNAHVLCEKPMGISLAQATEIEQRAASADRIFCAGFNYRYLPGVLGLRDLLREGKLGRLFRVRMIIGHGGRPGMEEEWKLNKAKAGGGALIDPGIHLVDLARHLFGEPQVKAASLHRRFWNSDVEDNCFFTLGYGDVDVTIDVTLTSWKNLFSIEVFGDQGTALVRGRGGNYGTQYLEFVNRWFWQDNDKRMLHDYGDEDPSFARETTAFIRYIESGLSDGHLSVSSDGRAALKIVEDLYQLAESRPPGTVPKIAAEE